MAEPTIPPLPNLLIARIFSYHVTSVMDVASLRLLGKEVGKEVTEQLPCFLPHILHCPQRRFGSHKNGSYVEQLQDIDRRNQRRIMAGVIFSSTGDGKGGIPMFRVIADDSRNVKIRVLDDPRSLCEVESVDIPNLANTTESTLVELRNICQSIELATSAKSWQELGAHAKSLQIFTQPKSMAPNVSNRDNFYFLSMVTVEISIKSKLIEKIVSYHGTNFYLLNHQVRKTQGWCFDCRREHGPTSPCEDDGSFLQHICRGGQSWAVELGPSNNYCLVLCSLMYLKSGQYQFERFVRSNDFRCDGMIDSISSTLLWLQHCQRQTQVEGVAIVDDFLSDHDRKLFQEQLTFLADQPGRNREIVDPLFYMKYCRYSNYYRSKVEEEPCQFSGFGPHPEVEPMTSHDRVNFWGRMYHSGYDDDCWMIPSYVSVSPHGDCSFDTYVMHLGSSPQDPVHSGIYQSLSVLFKRALPYIESVFSYSYAMSRLLLHRDDQRDQVASPLQPLNIQPISLRGQKLQVITRITDYGVEDESDHSNKTRDRWELDGLTCEEIVLTCVYIMDDDVSLQGGSWEFRRVMAPDEKRLLPHCYLLEMIPMGTVATCSGRLIVYPNCHAYRFQPTSGKVRGRCRMVFFHLVNPQRRILSTLEFRPPEEVEHTAKRFRTDLVEQREREKIHNWGLMAPVRSMTQPHVNYKDNGKFWHY